jgi:hypothetical protein
LVGKRGGAGFFAPGGTEEKGYGRCRDEECGEVLKAEEKVGGDGREAGLVVVAGVGEKAVCPDQENDRREGREFLHPFI